MVENSRLSINMEGHMWSLPDLVPFVQFEKHEKHPWKSVNFSKVAG